MKAKNIVNNTTNRGEFNRAYKRYLEGKGKISCSYCQYNRNENGKGRGHYGGYERTNGHMNLTHPNWKLVSKNRKQWMKKPVKFVEIHFNWRRTKYIDITW